MTCELVCESMQGFCEVSERRQFNLSQFIWTGDRRIFWRRARSPQSRVSKPQAQVTHLLRTGSNEASPRPSGSPHAVDFLAQPASLQSGRLTSI